MLPRAILHVAAPEKAGNLAAQGLPTQEAPRPLKPASQATGISQGSGMKRRLLSLQGYDKPRASLGSHNAGVLETELFELNHTRVLVSLCSFSPQL